MKRNYKKTFAIIITLIISMNIYSQLEVNPTALEFGDRERGYFLSKLEYEVTNSGTDTAFITYAHSTSAFINENVWTYIAPGESISNFIKLDRSFAAGQYSETLYLETSLGNASFDVTANIIDNTPTITFNDIYFWVGTGSSRAVLAFDFNDGLENESIAIGYNFSGTVQAEEMINDIADKYSQLTVNITSSLLYDVTYDNHTGIGGSPEYWSTFSRTSNSLWEMNWGMTTIVDNGEWFGCSYTGGDADYNPLHLPGNSSWAGYPLSVPEITESNLNIFPNPAINNICIESNSSEIRTIQIIDLSGKIIRDITLTAGLNKTWVNISDLANGIYQINIYTNNSIETQRLVKN